MGSQTSPAPLDTNEQRRTITQIINHPNFNSATNDNDIAVIKVSGTFNCGTHISPACLPNPNVICIFPPFLCDPSYFLSQGYEYVGWQDTIVSGWGASFFGGGSVDILQWVNVPPVARSTCNQFDYYNGVVTANMICAGKNTPVSTD